MIEYMGEVDLGGGFAVKWAFDFKADSPRTWGDNLSHFYTWVRGYSSPDENPYADEVQFMSSMLEEHFTFDELHTAVESKMFDALRFKPDKLHDEHLVVRHRNMLVGKTGWDVVQDYEEYRDAEALARAIAICAEAPALLARKVALRTVYMLDHSGIAFSTSPFCDRWDSGAVGFIYADDSDVERCYGGAKPTREKVERELDADVELYSSWASGECYTVYLFLDWVMVDWSRGYIGESGLEEGIQYMRGRIPKTA